MKIALAITTATAGTLVFAGVVFAQAAEDAFGEWLNTANKAKIELYKCGNNLCGKLLSVADGQKVDSKNPDPAKRSQPIEGLVFMESFKRDGANKWSGKSYNRADGKSYPATLTVKSKDAVDLTPCSAPGRCSTFKLIRFGSMPRPDAEACSGPTKIAKGPSGKTLTLCLDGKYSTCLRDSQRLGNSYAAAKRYCDGRKAGGFVK
jgi:uncharacterized protein (DUF2147 family)